MSNVFKVAAIPLDINWGNKARNLNAVEKILGKLPFGLDLVVLPETFTTAYIQDPTLLEEIAETNSGRTIDTIHRWSTRYGFAICGSFIATDGVSNYYNRAFFIEPSGDEYYYDKRHLFTISGEGRLYTRGDRESPIIRFRGWNIKLAVCYDLRFPVWCRKRENEYDILIFPANWAHSRAYAFRHLLIARAIENQAFVIGCNRSGTDDYGSYPATDSDIFNNWGDSIGRMDENEILFAEFDYDKFNTDREKFPAYRDNDDFRLIID